MVCRPGQQRDRDEGNAAPDIGGDQREARRPGRAEEVDIGGAPVQHVDQKVGDDRELRIVDPPERQRREHRRHDPGHQDDRTQQALERKMVVEQQCEPEAERELSKGRDPRVDHAVEHRVPPQGIGEQILEILEADEDAFSADRRVGEGEPDAEAERIGQEHREQPDRRCEAHHDQERLVVEQAHQPGGLPVHEGRRRECGHGHRFVVPSLKVTRPVTARSP